MSSHLRPFGMIGTSLWQSAKFQGIKSLEARLAYIWLHTSQKTCAGVLRIGAAHLVEEVDFIESMDHAKSTYHELSDAGLIEWCKPYVIIHNFLRFNPIKSYRHAIGAFNEVLVLPDGEAKERLFKALQKQKGAVDLLNWRDKAGEPHRVIFAINDFLAGLEDRIVKLETEFAKLDNEAIIVDCVNPSEAPHEPLTTPSGKSRSKSINEKVESRTPALPEKTPKAPSIPNQELKVTEFRTGRDTAKRSTTHASESAKKSALAMGCR